MICLGLAACGSPGRVVQPDVSGGNRSDGIVTMSSMTSIYQPVQPDLLVAAEEAGRQCRSWGLAPRASHDGTREFCRHYDSWGRCTTTEVTRYYRCGS